MKERPILFNTEMVHSILWGDKTQTRRIIKDSTKEGLEVGYQLGECYALDDSRSTGCKYIQSFCPLGEVGDRLWVRETFCYGQIDEFDAEHPDDRQLFVDQTNSSEDYPVYKQWCLENDADIEDVIWTPSIHMPRSACRIVLEITDIRVERLNSISEQDAKAEGCDNSKTRAAISVGWYEKPIRAFKRLWERFHGECSWYENPWVWVVEFKVVKGGVE